MLIIGEQHLERLLAGEMRTLKMVFNERGAMVFPETLQHRDQSAEGIRYRDDYKGDAMAALVRRDAIEIRFHQGFTAEKVRGIVEKLLATPAFVVFRGVAVTYQGKALAG